MQNPWEAMTIEDGRAMDKRKEEGRYRFRTEVTREMLWRTIAKHLPEDRNTAVLDLGGGTGFWALRLAEEGHRVVLADISRGLLACAREKIEAAGVSERVRIVETDMCDLRGFDEGSFEVVLVLGGSLSYCGDAAGALGEIHRVTAEEGVVIGDVENRYRTGLFERRARSWEEARRILVEGEARWPDEADGAAIRAFAPAELEALLKETGWDVACMYPSDAVASCVREEIFEEAVQAERGLAEVLALEARLREEGSLLGAGADVQFVARKGARSACVS